MRAPCRVPRCRCPSAGLPESAALFPPALQVQVPAFHREVPLPPPPAPMASYQADPPAPCFSLRRRSAAESGKGYRGLYVFSWLPPVFFSGWGSLRALPAAVPPAVTGHLGCGSMRVSAPADGLDLLLPSFAHRDVSQVSISQKYSVSLSASYTAKVTFSEARSRRFCPSPASLWRSIRR